VPVYNDYYLEFEQKLNAHMNALRFDFNHFDYFQYDLLAHVLDNIPAMLQAAALDKFKDILQEQPVAVVAAEPT